ncbi:MAG: CoA-binding protein [Candidatus Hodarchaeota archaeon]
MHILDYFFQPKSIAIIGASKNPIAWGNWVSQSALGYKEKRNVYLINPKTEKILGEKTYPSLSAIDDQVDFAAIILPTKKVPTALEECLENGVKVATIITAGYAETEEGRPLQDELEKISKRGIRLQGPNCNGFYNVAMGINVSAIPNKFLRDSPVAFVTQSGYIGHALSLWGGARNFSFGKYISVGNEADLTITDYLEYFSNDPTVKVIVLYIEGLKDGKRFFKVAKNAIQKRPIIVWKTGETKAVARAASSHTGKIVGSKSIFDGVAKQIGFIQITEPEHILPLSQALIKHPALNGKRIGVMTIGAGFAVILTNAISNNGFIVPEFSDAVKTKLRKVIKEYRASIKNPIDIGAAGDYDLNTIIKPMKILFNENAVDAIVMANIGENELVFEEAGLMENYLAKQIQQLEQKYERPILLYTIISEFESKSVKKISKRGPVYHSVSEVVTVLKGLYQFRQNELKFLKLIE